MSDRKHGSKGKNKGSTFTALQNEYIKDVLPGYLVECRKGNTSRNRRTKLIHAGWLRRFGSDPGAADPVREQYDSVDDNTPVVAEDMEGFSKRERQEKRNALNKIKNVCK